MSATPFRRELVRKFAIQDLCVSYGPRRVLHGISLEVCSGEIVALIGPNGAGKSTLIRAASGVIPVEHGTICMDELDLNGLSALAQARHLAVVPQATSMPPAFTAWETVLLGRTPYLNFLGQTSTRDDEITRASLEKVDALDLADRRVGELSGGEQQRILLARALAQSTPVLLMDEPTAHLDLQHQVGLLELVRDLARTEHLAVLVAIHDLNLAARYADRVVLMVAGGIRAAGTAQQILTPELISDVYHLPVQVIAHPFAEGPLILPGVKKNDRSLD